MVQSGDTLHIPLSEKLRPRKLKEIAGQDHLTQKGGLLQQSIESKIPFSILFYGPPGSGKTTLARTYIQSFSLPFKIFSGSYDKILEIKKWIDKAKTELLFAPGIIFIDEIHRFNKLQQDVFLPFIETGELILVGATTENPSFEINHALLSRMRTLVLEPLSEEALMNILKNYETKIGLIELTEQAKKHLIQVSGGDARHLLNLIENLETAKEKKFDSQDLTRFIQKRAASYDKNKDEHFNLISALHKSVRGCDADAALYWLARILKGGEDPIYIGRRLIRMATEDIGLADPGAIQFVYSCVESYRRLGSPEGDLCLAEAVIYLALAPKSNRCYVAYQKASQLADSTSHHSPPKTILNAPTEWMKKQGYSKGYIYDHDTPFGFSGQNYFPDKVKPSRFYEPIERGFERQLEKRIAYFQKLKENSD